MAVDAVKKVRKISESSTFPCLISSDGKVHYPIENISIIKSHGQSALQSELLDGLVLSGSRASQQMPRRVEDARVLVLDFPLQRYKTQMGVEVKTGNPDELERIKQQEMEITKRQVTQLLTSGANVIVTGHGIDDLCLKYLVEAGCIGMRRVGNDDLVRLAKATGAEILVVELGVGI
jgi:T-complex protein 1 subunit alpha